MKPYLLAVDGGGTKTAFSLCRRDGSPVCRLTVGAASHKAVGEAAARRHLTDGLAQLLQQANASVSQIAYSVWGISGCDAASDFALFRRITQELGFSPDRCRICNDAAMGYFAAADAPGVILVGGTGAIAVGVRGDGSTCRAGGWGYNFSDLGSGQWLGNAALRETLRWCDGCRAFVPWFEEVRAHFGAASFAALPQTVTTVEEYSIVAGLAPVLFRNEEEPLAAAILEEGAAHLAELADACLRRLGLPEGDPCTLVLAGGCLRQPVYAKLVRQALMRRPCAAGLRLAPLTGDPVEGGIRLAQQMIKQLDETSD